MQYIYIKHTQWTINKILTIYRYILWFKLIIILYQFKLNSNLKWYCTCANIGTILQIKFGKITEILCYACTGTIITITNKSTREYPWMIEKQWALECL